MIGASHSVNKRLGHLCTPLILSAEMEIELSSDSGQEEGEECKDLKEVGHHFCQDMFAVDGWWIRLPHVAPAALGPCRRKLWLCCGPTICHQRNILLNKTIPE